MLAAVRFRADHYLARGTRVSGVDEENEAPQLKALAAVARRLRSPDVLDELRRAPNRALLYNVLIERKCGRSLRQSSRNTLSCRPPRAPEARW
jgi:hypothetical protein